MMNSWCVVWRSLHCHGGLGAPARKPHHEVPRQFQSTKRAPLDWPLSRPGVVLGSCVLEGTKVELLSSKAVGIVASLSQELVDSSQRSTSRMEDQRDKG